MNATAPIDSLIADAIAELKQPDMTVAHAVSILANLAETVYYDTPRGQLEESQASYIAATLEETLGVGEVYDPAATSWYGDEDGEIEYSPLINLINTMKTLGLPMLQLQLSDPDENIFDFLGAGRPIEIEYDPDDTTRPNEDVTDLTAEWITNTLAAQAATNEAPGLYFRLTMPDTAWSFERELPVGDTPTDAFFAFSNGHEVLAAMIIYPDSCIEEQGNILTLHDVDFVVRVSSMLDNFTDEGTRVSQEAIDQAERVAGVIKLKSLMFARSTHIIVGYEF